MNTYVFETSEYVYFLHNLLQFVFVFDLREYCLTSNLSTGMGIESEMNRGEATAMMAMISLYTQCWPNSTHLPKQ